MKKRTNRESMPREGYRFHEVLMMIGIIFMGIGVSYLIMVLTGFRPGYYLSRGWGNDADIIRSFA